MFGDKPDGLFVDYPGIAADLKQALAFYGDAGGRGDPARMQEQAVTFLLEKLDVLAAMFYGFAVDACFSADTSRKPGLLLEATDFVLGLKNGKRRFLDTVSALSAAFALAVPHRAGHGPG